MSSLVDGVIKRVKPSLETERWRLQTVHWEQRQRNRQQTLRVWGKSPRKRVLAGIEGNGRQQYHTHRRGGEVARVLPGGGNCMSGWQ